VMALLFGDGSDAVYKLERLHKIRERERPRKAVFVDDLPMGEIRKLLVNVGKFFPLERRDASSARNTGAGCEFGHEDSVSKLKMAWTMHEMPKFGGAFSYQACSLESEAQVQASSQPARGF
jgi:hypothetical protein